LCLLDEHLQRVFVVLPHVGDWALVAIPAHLDAVRAAPVDHRWRIIQGPVGRDARGKRIVDDPPEAGAVHRDVVVPIDGRNHNL